MRLKTSSSVLAIGLTLTAFQNCAKAKFAGSTSASSAAAAGTCAGQLQTIAVPVKLLFVVDTSGSNATDYTGVGTDNNKSVRGGSIQQFMTNYRTRTNFSYGFETFSGSTAQSLIGTTAQPTFTNSVAEIQYALTRFYGIVDNDLTPYQAALNLASQTIAMDQTYTAQTKYIVVFLSDGLPDPNISDATLQADIRAMINLHPGQITFNTIYYGLNDTVATQRLAMMAAIGNGKSVNGQSFAISDVTTIPGTNCQ